MEVKEFVLEQNQGIQAGHFLKDQQLFYHSSFIPSPKISVILPTYNRGSNGLLNRAIMSVLHQTLPEFELIIVDDGSTDETPHIVKNFQKADHRILYVRHTQTSGLPALRMNEGFALARGEYIAHQFADDLWTPKALAILYDVATKQVRPSLIYGKCLFYHHQSQTTLGRPFDYSRLADRNFIANNSVLHPRQFVEESGGYDCHAALRPLCDWDLWLRWGKKYPFVYVDQIVSIIDTPTGNAIGKKVPLDLNITRILLHIQKDSLLTPSSFSNYILNDLRIVKQLLPPEKEQMLDAYLHPWHQNQPPLPKEEEHRRKKVVLVIKVACDATLDITVHNFQQVPGNHFFSYFVPEHQANAATLELCDVILFHRTCGPHSCFLQETAKVTGKPVIYLLDDDLLGVYELGPEFRDLAPGTPMYQALEKQLAGADLVVTYSPVVSDVIKRLNPRVKTMKTNILQKYLQRDFAVHRPHAPFRILYTGGIASRNKEFQALWSALVAFSEEKKNEVEFHFWGLNPDDFPPLSSPVYYQSFTLSYYEYLERLVSSHFHVMLSPLFEDCRSKKGKCPIKYLESVAAGCIGIFSDVYPYQEIKHGETGLKVAHHTVEAWLHALHRVYDMSDGQRRVMWQQAREHILYEYTTESQVEEMDAVIEAAKLQARWRGKRSEQGLSRIAYFFPSPYLTGAENQLFRYAVLLEQFGFKPIFCFADSFVQTGGKIIQIAKESEYDYHFLPFHADTHPSLIDGQEAFQRVNQIQQWLVHQQIALVHSAMFMPHVSQAARRVQIPHVASLPAVAENHVYAPYYAQAFHASSVYFQDRWEKMLATKGKCMRGWVPNSFFQSGRQKITTKQPDPAPTPLQKVGMLGTLQIDKGQLQAIEAVGLLKDQIEMELHLVGYTHFFPEYYEQCKEMSQRYDIEDRVQFHDACDDSGEYLQAWDVLLCASTWGDFPQSILEAMAAGVPIVANSISAIAELIVDGVTGILIPDSSPAAIAAGLASMCQLSVQAKRERIQAAFAVVRRECAAGHVAKELLGLYEYACLQLEGRKRIV
jgi:O-antigen biosynthesis protein